MKRAGIFDRRSALNRKANQLNSVLGNSRIGKDSDGFENLDEYFASSPRRDVPLVSDNATAVEDTKNNHNDNNDNNYDEYNPLSPTNIPLTEMQVQSDNNLLLKSANSIHHHNYNNDVSTNNNINNNDDNDDANNFEDNNTMQEDFGDLPAFDDFQDDEDTAGRSDVNQSDDDDEVIVRDSIPVRLSMPPAPREQKKTQQKKTTAATTTKPKPLRRLAAIIPDDDDDTSYKRRSNRKRMEPLKYWAGERPKYGRRESSRMPVIVDILPPTTKIAPPRKTVQRKKNKAAAAGTTAAAAKAQSTTTPKGPVSILTNLKGVSGFKADVNFTGTVMDFDEHVEMDRLLALGPDNVDLKTVTNENFMIQSIFSEAGTLSSGILHFPPRTAKESRNSLNHCLVCYVVEGTFQITIHQNVFIVGTGSQFIVPRGNQYSIKSLWDKDGRLFFAHCTIGEKQ